jgi:hypothetical protein
MASLLDASASEPPRRYKVEETNKNNTYHDKIEIIFGENSKGDNETLFKIRAVLLYIGKRWWRQHSSEFAFMVPLHKRMAV